MNIKVIIFSLLIVNTANVCSDHIESKLLENIDKGSYEGWTAEGNAFANGPVEAGEFVGALGMGFASSANQDDVTATGTLTSEPLIIIKKLIHFLIGSHEIFFLDKDNDKLVVQLLIVNKVVRSTVPKKFHAMFWKGWDVTEFEGKTAQFRIVDNDDRE